jgi:putative acetyltransferase
MVKLLSNQSVKRSYPEGNHPWAIARLLPNAQTIIVARFHNRQDADDHKRLLHRFIPNAQFEIIFDLPNDKEEEHQTQALS